MASACENPPVEIETGPSPTASIIWLHGLGADGHDFEPIVPELQLPSKLSIRFVFPHAPMRAVTINGGAVMRAWYDLAMSESGLMQNPEHLRESEIIVQELIARERSRGIAANRIILAGFSQGGVLALQTGLHFSETLAGILVLSAPLSGIDRLLTEIHPANSSLPVFLAYGTEDPLVSFALAQQVYQKMKHHPVEVTWHAYPTGHSVTMEEIRDIATWFLQILKD